MKKLSSQKREILRNQVAAFAEKFAGAPYKYGARESEAPKYFDCSSFIQYVYRHFGYEIPRSTILQAEFAGKVIRNIKHLKLGDLIFFRSQSGHYNKKFPQGIGHMAMYLGEGRAIHAASKRFKVYPKIVEKGRIRIEPLEKIAKECKPLVVVKRII
jgi:cell wall-associated NlpC family hydrolase